MEKQLTKEHTAQENTLLSRTAMAISFSDFIALFAFLRLLTESGLSPLVAGWSVVFKTMAIATASIFIPNIISKVDTRRLIMISRGSTFTALLGVLALHQYNALTPSYIFAFLFIQSFFKQVFEVSKEYHSKFIGEGGCQKSLQSQLLGAFYSAQLIGPIISVALLTFTSSTVSLLAALLLELIGVLICSLLTFKAKPETSLNILRPFKYLRNFPLIIRMLVVRSFLGWIGFGLYNYLLFTVVKENFGIGIEHSAWFYSVLGLGATLGSYAIRNPVSGKLTKAGSINEGTICLIGYLVLGAAIVVFITTSSLPTALLASVFGGSGMGVSAIASQSIRRKITTTDQFPEIVALDMVIARVTDLSICALAAWFISTGLITWNSWLLFAACSFAVVGLLYHSWLKLEK